MPPLLSLLNSSFFVFLLLKPLISYKGKLLTGLIFISEPSTDPATIQEVSEYVLSLKLPVDALSLQRKVNDIRSIAEKMPNVELVLSQTREDIARAKKLQTDAEDAKYVKHSQRKYPEMVLLKVHLCLVFSDI